MDENNEARDEDVVVIEERDKRTYLYILIASILSLALGGLVGSSLTAKNGKHTMMWSSKNTVQWLQTKKPWLIR